MQGLLISTLIVPVFILSALALARDVFEQPKGIGRWLAASVIGFTWLILGVELLGGLGWFGQRTLLFWTCVLLAAALFGTRYRKAEVSVANSQETMEWQAIVAIGVVLWASVILCGASILNAVKVVSDAPIYHLYFAARWWKSGSIAWIASPFGENAATYFPAVGDLWFTTLMVLASGDRLARVGQAPFLILAGLASYQTSKRLGAGTSASILATSWFLTATPLFIFSFEANVDTIFVAWYLVAVYFFFEWVNQAQGRGQLLFSGLASGLALGTKAPAIVFVPVLTLIQFAYLVFVDSGTGRARRLATVLITPIVAPGFFYARNAWATGNPFYPLHFQAFGRVILPGWYGPEVMAKSQYFIPFSDWRALVDTLLAVVDPRLAPFWLLGLVTAWFARKPSPRVTSNCLRAIAALAILNVVIYWCAIPYRTQQRFMLHAVGLAAIPLAVFFERSRWLRNLGLILLTVHVTTPQNWPFSPQSLPWDFSKFIPNAIGSPILLSNQMGPLSIVLGIGLLAVVTTWLWCRTIERPRRNFIVGAAACTLILLIVTTVTIYPWGTDARRQFFPPFPDYLRGWVETDLRSGSAGVRLAYAGNALPYYLMGVGLRNDVRYVNIASHRNWLLHDFHREASRSEHVTWKHPRPGWDRQHPDYDAWLANLHEERIQLLVVNRVNPDEGPHNIADVDGFPIERQWAESHPQSFQVLYGVAERDPQYRLYRVLPPR